MNKIAHILAAAFGVAFAVALAATFSPTPSVSWALWALVGGAVGCLVQDPIGVLREANATLRDVAKIAARRLRHSWRKVSIYCPLWFRVAVGTLRPGDELLFGLIFLSLAYLVSLTPLSGFGPFLLVICLCIFAVFSYLGADPDEILADFRRSFRPSSKVVEWRNTRPPLLGGRCSYETLAEYKQAARLGHRHSRRALRGMTAGEVFAGLAWSWVSFLAWFLKMTAITATASVVLLIAVEVFYVISFYPIALVSVATLALSALFWRLILRGAGKVVLASARRLHTQKRLVAGAAATLGTISGLVASFAWGILGVPILAAALGAAIGASFAWGLSTVSSCVLSRFGFATA